MYLLLNTAISTTWGFPVCGDGCACDCFDASDPACECALDPEFYSLFPAEFVIDYVSDLVFFVFPPIMYTVSTLFFYLFRSDMSRVQPMIGLAT